VKSFTKCKYVYVVDKSVTNGIMKTKIGVKSCTKTV